MDTSGELRILTVEEVDAVAGGAWFEGTDEAANREAIARNSILGSTYASGAFRPL